jgi:hypothetical protein
MRFTLQPVPLTAESTHRSEWSVVLDNEHLMFVGTLRECEDWLDWQQAELPQNRPSRLRRVWQRLTYRYQEFVRQEAGCTEAQNALTLGLLLASVYLLFLPVLWGSSLTIPAWGGTTIGRLGASRDHTSACSGWSLPQCQQAIEIACDFPAGS